MLVLLAIAALAVLYCVVVVSQGRGGELVDFAPDVPPVELPAPGQLTAADFMELRLPVSLVGYHTQTVDETLQRAATAIGQRDTHIAVLEQRVEELLAGRMQARQESYVESYARPSWAPIATPEPSPPVSEHESAEALFGAIGPASTSPRDIPAEGSSGTRGRGLTPEPPDEERGPFEAAGEKRGVSDDAPAEERGSFERGPFEVAGEEPGAAGKERGSFETPEGFSGKHAVSKGGGLTAGDRPDPKDAR